MPKSILSLIFTSITFINISQVDYNDIKDQYIHVCGQLDSVSVYKNVAFIDSVAKLKVTDGRKEFLLDYADAYLRKKDYSKVQADLLVYLNCITQIWEEYKDPSTLISLAVTYSMVDNCYMSRKYIFIINELVDNNEMEPTDFITEQLGIIQEYICPE